jgi:hypothetical protein
MGCLEKTSLITFFFIPHFPVFEICVSKQDIYLWRSKRIAEVGAKSKEFDLIVRIPNNPAELRAAES